MLSDPRAELTGLDARTPFEKGQKSSRPTFIVPEVQMVGCGIVEVDSLLDQPQTKNSSVEHCSGRGIGSDCRDVM